MTGPGLRDAQLWMLSAITGAEADAADPERFIKPGPRMDPAACLDVYRSAYRARLVECLVDDYPVLARTLGAERFEALAVAYLDRFPSSSPNLNGFGARLPGYCREAPPALLGPLAPFASELAALEWSLVEVLHARASEPLDVSVLEAASPLHWATARFVASHAVRLLRFEHPVDAYYQASLERDRCPDVPGPAPSATLVYRTDLRVWRMTLTPMMTRVLEPLLAGETIGDVLEAIEPSITTEAEAAELGGQLTVWFRDWAAAGLFARVEWTSG